MSDPLTHFDEAGAARMVKITEKPETSRLAIARARVRMAAQTLRRIQEGTVGKGDVLAVARLGGIAAAKQTAHAIPLCHPVRITGIDVRFEVDVALPGVIVTAEVHAHDRTGPDMEAMSAACGAALTVYDMCKAMDREMVIEEIVLLAKQGGTSGRWSRGG